MWDTFKTFFGIAVMIGVFWLFVEICDQNKGKISYTLSDSQIEVLKEIPHEANQSIKHALKNYIND